MKISRFYVSKARNSENAYNTDLFGTLGLITSEDTRYDDVDRLYYNFKYDACNKENVLKEVMTKYGISETPVKKARTKKPVFTSAEDIDETTLQNLKDSIQALMNFFSEFEFEPNFRFVNTFSYYLQNSKAAAKEYIKNYFKLTDSPYTPSIIEKMKSYEFTEIMDKMAAVVPTHRVNNRFKIYYGSQGTGKTTEAMKETDNVCMVCHSAMLPSDLMEDFQFNDGKAAFTPSVLMKAMINGTKIVLDEINLLPFESLRFLQTILDGKSEFMYKGTEVKIADGFQIIGTMNLSVNGSVFSVPEPLVDRCQEIKEYKLTVDSLLGAIL